MASCTTAYAQASAGRGFSEQPHSPFALSGSAPVIPTKETTNPRGTFNTEAADSYTRALLLSPADRVLLGNRSAAHLAAGRVDEALADAQVWGPCWWWGRGRRRWCNERTGGERRG
jgi:hypothetical protein